MKPAFDWSSMSRWSNRMVAGGVKAAKASAGAQSRQISRRLSIVGSISLKNFIKQCERLTWWDSRKLIWIHAQKNGWAHKEYFHEKFCRLGRLDLYRSVWCRSCATKHCICCSRTFSNHNPSLIVAMSLRPFLIFAVVMYAISSIKTICVGASWPGTGSRTSYVLMNDGSGVRAVYPTLEGSDQAMPFSRPAPVSSRTIGFSKLIYSVIPGSSVRDARYPTFWR